MLIFKLLRGVYSGIGSFVNSIYHWLTGTSENNPGIDDANSDDNANPVIVLQPNVPPVPPPLAGLQLFAAMHFPFLQRNRPSLRDLLQPLADALSERPPSPQPQLRLGKRWRRETQAENMQAIEKALEQFEMEESVTKQDSKTSVATAELKDSNEDICHQNDTD